MENINIAVAKMTPMINFDSNTGVLVMEGKSFPENTFEFYKPVLEWLKNYFVQTSLDTKIIFRIVYCNSTTSKILYDMFDMFQNACDEGKSISIKWEFLEDNDAAEEIGEDFKDDFEDLDIELVQID